MGSRNFSRKKKRTQPQKHQVPHKFSADERVLCYEPDMKKARVLYDSKVLEVVERIDKGKIRAEYKIHFFGWNSSWDRYVAEECVLKDTEENRNLQKELKAKADIFILAHVKNKKQRKKTLTEILKEATKDKSGKSSKPGSADVKNDDEISNSSGSSDSSDQESSDDDDKEIPQIVLTDKVKAILEQDYHNLMTRNMLVKIPAEVSVVCVFEGYVKFLGFRELRKVIEQHKAVFFASEKQPSTSASSSANFSSSSTTSKMSSTNKTNPNDFWIEDIARTYRKVRQSQEIVHGLKVIFDYMLYQMLLYEVENEQFTSFRTVRPRMPDINCSLLVPQLPTFGPPAAPPAASVDTKKKQQKKDDQEVEVPTPTSKQNKVSSEESKDGETSSKLRKNAKTTTDDSTCKERKSDRKCGDSSAIKSHSTAAGPILKCLYDGPLWIKSVTKYINELKSWQMLPEDCYKQEFPDPCMVYGLIHVLRFFVKLPDILNRMLIPKRKVRIISHHANQMIDHIQTCYVFSITRLYICLPRCVYEEDQICVMPSATEDNSSRVNKEMDTDLSQYSTRNYRSLVLAKAKPQLAKIVEVPLSTTAEGLEEHQLTIRNTASLPKNLERSIKDRKKNTVMVPHSSASIAVKIEHQHQIKQEQMSPNIAQKPQMKRKPLVKDTSKPPVLPMMRQIRKSAAHAAFKTAHMFASQQNITSRTLAASAVIKIEVEDEPVVAPRKRSLPTDAPTSESKRVTRMSESRTSSSDASAVTERKSRQDEPKSSIKAEKGTSNPSPEPSGSDSPSRLVKPKKINHVRDIFSRRGSNSRSSSSPVQKVRNSDSERKDQKPKAEPKKITSPRHSKSSGSSKDSRSGKTIHKSTSPTSTIRLRSRSDERQLRSKGSLIHALSLPMQATPRSTHSIKLEGDKSPKRRESTGGTRDSVVNTPLITKKANSRII